MKPLRTEGKARCGSRLESMQCSGDTEEVKLVSKCYRRLDMVRRGMLTESCECFVAAEWPAHLVPKQPVHPVLSSCPSQRKATAKNS